MFHRTQRLLLDGALTYLNLGEGYSRLINSFLHCIDVQVRLRLRQTLVQRG